jgi:tetraacyldisaccharide-1-P 4'-kinase
LNARAKLCAAEILLCTMKDLVKIESDCPLPMAALLIDLAFLNGEEEVKQKLKTITSDQAR